MCRAAERSLYPSALSSQCALTITHARAFRFARVDQSTGETSPQALADPYNSDITLAYGFIALPFLQTVLTDTHFVERDRMGRMLTFLARVIHDQKLLPTPASSPIRAVGVDAGTALLLNATTGLATIVGLGTAYVCTPSQIASVILPGQVRPRLCWPYFKYHSVKPMC